MTPRRKTPVPPADGLMDLFGAPEVSAGPVEPPDPLWGALNVTWKKPPAGRHLCQDCVDIIHRKLDGPHPLVATARRCGPNGERLLCSAHAQIRRDEDDRVTRKHAGAIAAQKAAQKAAVDGFGRKQREHS